MFGKKPSVDGGKKKHSSMDENTPGPVSFADFRVRTMRSIDSTGYAESILDEENIHWRVFFTRIFLIILLLLVIICLGLYDLNPGFLFLACFIGAFLILCLVATFVDLSFLYRCCAKKQESTPANPVVVPPTIPAEIIEAPVDNPFGNYHNRL